MDIAYAPFVERFHPLFLDVNNYDVTKGRPRLTKWIEVIHNHTKLKRNVVSTFIPMEYFLGSMFDVHIKCIIPKPFILYVELSCDIIGTWRYCSLALWLAYCLGNECNTLSHDLPSIPDPFFSLRVPYIHDPSIPDSFLIFENYGDSLIA